MASRALVLGGGHIAAAAWQLGVIAGLAHAGLDLTAADLVVGTSPGALVAAQLTTGIPVQQLYQRQLAGGAADLATPMNSSVLIKLAWASLGTHDQREIRVRLGALALTTKTAPMERWLAVIAARLPVHQWPQQRMLITAVAAEDGEPAVFDRNSGVPLVEAVAASCAMPGFRPPIRIGGRHYMDGSGRSPANVDLARGYQRVVVVTPVIRTVPRTLSVETQVAAMPAGTAVVVVSPDRKAQQDIARNVADPSRRKVTRAAQAGWRQAADVVAHVAAVWSR